MIATRCISLYQCKLEILNLPVDTSVDIWDGIYRLKQNKFKLTNLGKNKCRLLCRLADCYDNYTIFYYDS